MTAPVELTRFRMAPSVPRRCRRPGPPCSRTSGPTVPASWEPGWSACPAANGRTSSGASRAKGANPPGIRAFCELIDELMSAEEGTTAGSED